MKGEFKVLTFDGRCVVACLENRIVLSETGIPKLLSPKTTISDLEKTARQNWQEPWVNHVIDNIRKCDLITVKLSIVMQNGEV